MDKHLLGLKKQLHIFSFYVNQQHKRKNMDLGVMQICAQFQILLYFTFLKLGLLIWNEKNNKLPYKVN